MDVIVAARVALKATGLVVELRQDGDLQFLDVQSRIDPRQDFLLPVPPRPAFAGLSMHTRMGRLHAVCWGLVYGSSPLPDAGRVRFEADTLRYRQVAEVPVHRVSERCWVAGAEGVFSTAVLLTPDIEVGRVRLTSRW